MLPFFEILLKFTYLRFELRLPNETKAVKMTKPHGKLANTAMMEVIKEACYVGEVLRGMWSWNFHIMQRKCDLESEAAYKFSKWRCVDPHDWYTVVLPNIVIPNNLSL